MVTEKVSLVASAASGTDWNEELAKMAVEFLLSKIPYAGGIAKGIFGMLTADEVISWDDITDYVDAAIKKSELEKDVRDAATEVRALWSVFAEDYGEATEDQKKHSPGDYYGILSKLHTLVAVVHRRVLGSEAYDGMAEDDGLWHRAPWAMCSTVIQMLLLDAALLREMQADVYRNVDARTRTPEFAQDQLDNTIRAYLAASWALLPKAYEQRMKALAIVKEGPEEKTLPARIVYWLNWKDAWGDGHGEHSFTDYLKDDKDEREAHARMADGRVEYLSYWSDLNKIVTDELATDFVEPLDQILTLASPAVQEAEKKAREAAGTVFGAMRCHVKAYASEAHTPVSENATLSVYASARPPLPVMASTKHRDDGGRESWAWCIGVGWSAGDAPVAQIRVQYGLWENSKFDAKWSNASAAAGFEPGAPPTVSAKGVHGEYDWLHMSAEWLP